MQKPNYDQLMQDAISRFSPSGEKPRLLLHVCCAPCSSAVLERLRGSFRILAFFDNPNLDSAEEFELRAEETERLVHETGWADEVIVSPYDPVVFEEAVRGLETEKEGGARCAACFRLRLNRSAGMARERNCAFFTTTLTLSPRKNAALLNQLGIQAGETAGVPFLPSDFKKRGGALRSIQLSQTFGLYRQDYCGCTFSKRKE